VRWMEIGSEMSIKEAVACKSPNMHVVHMVIFNTTYSACLECGS
jgi:hypothetical protein